MSQGGTGYNSSLPPNVQPWGGGYGGDGSRVISDPITAFRQPTMYQDASQPTIQNPTAPSTLPEVTPQSYDLNAMARMMNGGQYSAPYTPPGGGAGAGGGGYSAGGNPPAGGGVVGADGQMYADRNAAPRAYTGGAFNPAANQWGDYSQATGDGLWGTDANGINRINGHVFAPSGLNSGNNDFSNWLNRFAPQFAQQNGPINRGTAQTWGAPPPMNPTMPPPGNGLGRGLIPPPMPGRPPAPPPSNGPANIPMTPPPTTTRTGAGMFDPRFMLQRY